MHPTNAIQKEYLHKFVDLLSEDSVCLFLAKSPTRNPDRVAYAVTNSSKQSVDDLIQDYTALNLEFPCK